MFLLLIQLSDMPHASLCGAQPSLGNSAVDFGQLQRGGTVTLARGLESLSLPGNMTGNKRP